MPEMARTKSSRRWLDRHFNDVYVKRAQQEGYRSRAIYKLIELQQKDHLLKPGMTVIDLGAALDQAEAMLRMIARQGQFDGASSDFAIYALDKLTGQQVASDGERIGDLIAQVDARLGDRVGNWSAIPPRPKAAPLPRPSAWAASMAALIAPALEPINTSKPPGGSSRPRSASPWSTPAW